MSNELQVIKNNELQVIVAESGLETTKAQFVLEKFQSYFQIAAEWEAKAKTIVVTDESQTAEMQLARVGRLFLRDKRIKIEKARKELKEQALREGKAIDGIAKVLKNLIEPIESYLDKQEHFVEIKAAEKEEKERIERERKAEEERIAKEKAEAEERERIRIENERLKAEAAERERKAAEDKKAHEELLAAERAKAAAEKKAVEDKAKAEAEKQEKLLAEQKAKADAERKAAEEKALKEKQKIEAKAAAEKKEKERLAEIIKNQIECPFCHRKFEMGER